MSTTYSDINPDDPLNSPLVEGPDAVLSSVENIIGTDKDERLFNLDLSADLDEFLLEPLSDDVASSIYGKITSAIQRHEPRASVIHNTSSVRVNAAENGYDVDLYLSIKGYEGNRFRLHAFMPRSGS